MQANFVWCGIRMSTETCVEANLASKMDIDGLANVVALSRSHFSRAFERSVGFSPMEYVVVRRVERAKAMISGTRESLAVPARASSEIGRREFR
jgi:AraC family transcriptional regulator